MSPDEQQPPPSDTPPPAAPPPMPGECDAMPEGEEPPPPGTRIASAVRWLLILLMATAAAAAWFGYWGVRDRMHAGADEKKTLYYCPMHPSVVEDHPGECPICGMTLVPKSPSGATPKPSASSTTPAVKVGRYYCPMHPDVTSDDPTSRCARCGGMKLVPRPGGGTAGVNMSDKMDMAPPAGVPGLGPVDLTPERIQLSGLRTAPVEKRPLASELRAVGYVAASEEGEAKIEARFAGWIESLAVNQTGERVAKGQVVATIYSPEVYAAEEEYLNARRWAAAPPGGAHEAHRATASLADDARHRLELLGIAREDLDEIARTGKAVRALPLRSPASGYVTAKSALPGLYVQPGTSLIEIADLSTVWVLVDIYEADIARVRVGAPATFELSAYPGKTFAGAVRFLYPDLDPSTRTLRARLVFKNLGLVLRPGMFGSATLKLPSSTGIVIPRDALVDTGTEQYVFVATGGGHFEPRRVKVGRRSDAGVEITDGLREGESVVTTANFLIDSESRLRAAIEGMSSGDAAPSER